MEKKKKNYAKAEIKIVEVKTEGVIAASGGEIIVPPEQLESILSPSCTSSYGDGGNALNLPIGKDGCFIANLNNGCKALDFYEKNGFKKNDIITIYHKQDNTYTIKKGCN